MPRQPVFPSASFVNLPSAWPSVLDLDATRHSLGQPDRCDRQRPDPRDDDRAEPGRKTVREGHEAKRHE